MPIYVCLVEEINNILHVYFLMFAHSAVVFWLYYMDYSWLIIGNGINRRMFGNNNVFWGVNTFPISPHL